MTNIVRQHILAEIAEYQAKIGNPDLTVGEYQRYLEEIRIRERQLKLV